PVRLVLAWRWGASAAGGGGAARGGRKVHACAQRPPPCGPSHPACLLASLHSLTVEVSMGGPILRASPLGRAAGPLGRRQFSAESGSLPGPGPGVVEGPAMGKRKAPV